MTTPVSGTNTQSNWSAQMQALQEQSKQESLVEMQTNMAINRNNAAAQAASSVGRT